MPETMPNTTRKRRRAKDCACYHDGYGGTMTCGGVILDPGTIKLNKKGEIVSGKVIGHWDSTCNGVCKNWSPKGSLRRPLKGC